ncbi:MAG: glutamate--tRNA ligase [Holophagaceae bacterium]|nr:glutamate--tRNA ligase [Holophagaceae bacterium]
MPRQVVTRFAPSPTGMLHIGGVRTALFCWLFARKHGGRFILRIEDTDTDRSTDDNIRIIEEGMAWCGLDWDEGPVVGEPSKWVGPNGPYRQMQRMESHYKLAVEKLLENGMAYRCRCSKEDLDARRKLSDTSDAPFQYNRGLDLGKGCCDKNYDASQPFSVRLKMPEGNEPWLENGNIVLHDCIKGQINFPAGSMDDWIIARTGETGQIGVPTYNFCVVVDDTSMEVTHVIRGDDHVTNTPKQIALYHALGFEPPVFAHVPMILGMDGAKLSKRHGATSITEYQELGFLPSAVRLALARLSWTPMVDGKALESAEEMIMTDTQMIELFDLDKIHQSPAKFDMDKLNWINHKLIQQSSWQELEPHLRPFLPTAWGLKSDEWKKVAITATQKGKSLAEMAVFLEFCWSAPTVFEGADKHITQRVIPALREVASLSDYEHDKLHASFNEILERNGLKTKDLAQALRVALCGKTISPGIFDTLYLLGVDEVKARLQRWI